MKKTWTDYLAEMKARVEEAAESNRGEMNLEVEEVLDVDIPDLVARVEELTEALETVVTYSKNLYGQEIVTVAREVLARPVPGDKP